MKPLLKSLKSRHDILEAKISAAQRQFLPDELRIRDMKKLKLRLKEQIALLEREDASATPLPARASGAASNTTRSR